MAATKPSKILILSSAEITERMAINDVFVTQLNEQLQPDYQLEWRNYHDIGLRLKTNHLEALVISSGVSLNNYAAVYFKSYFRYQEQAAAIAETLRANNIHHSSRELEHYISATKLTQLARLARGGLNVPETIYLPMEHYVSWFNTLQASFGKKFIFKAIDGSTGDDNYLVSSEAQLAELVARYHDRHFIAQKFIPNDSDLRVLIVGNDIKLIIERRRLDDSTHLNNTSQGAKARLIDLKDFKHEYQKISYKAAELMNRDVAGVDLMLEQGTGTPYILEVNASPQIGSGAYTNEKVTAYTGYFRNLAKKGKKAYYG